jgi:hypothetical protein
MSERKCEQEFQRIWRSSAGSLLFFGAGIRCAFLWDHDLSPFGTQSESAMDGARTVKMKV